MAIYSQLTSEQRYQIYALLKVRHTMTFIVDVLGKYKSPSVLRLLTTAVLVATVRYKLNGAAISASKASKQVVLQRMIGT